MFLRKYNALSRACWLEAYKRSSIRPPSNLFLTPVTRRKFFQGYRNARSAAQVMKAYSQAKFNTTRKLEGQTEIFPSLLLHTSRLEKYRFETNKKSLKACNVFRCLGPNTISSQLNRFEPEALLVLRQFLFHEYFANNNLRS